MGKAAKERLAAAVLNGQRWNEDEARRVLAACEASGDPVAGFANRHGLDAQRLYWWRRRLGRASHQLAQASSTAFIPVRVRGGSAVADDVAGVVVSLDDVRIEVREVDAATAGWVSMVVASLTQARS